MKVVTAFENTNSDPDFIIGRVFVMSELIICTLFG